MSAELAYTPPFMVERGEQQGPSISGLVSDLVTTHSQLIGAPEPFNYSQLPEGQQAQLEAILQRIQRGRVYNRRTRRLELPESTIKPETVHDHVIDLLRAGQEIQQLSFLTRQRMGEANPNYFGLAEAVNWAVYATNAVFHDIGEGNKYGDLPRSVEATLGEKEYLRRRKKHAGAEERYFRKKVLPIIGDHTQREQVRAMYEAYETRDAREWDASLQLLHIVDKIRGTVAITNNGAPDAKAARQGGIKSALTSVKSLLPHLSIESKRELSLYLYQQLAQVHDMPQALAQLRETLSTAVLSGAEDPKLKRADILYQGAIIAKKEGASASGEEIEEKFVVTGDINLAGLEQAAQSRDTIWQGYIEISDDGSEKRIRQKGGRFYYTEKSGGDGIRTEEEFEITEEAFYSLLPLVKGRVIEKTRYKFPISTTVHRETDGSQDDGQQVDLETLELTGEVDVYRGPFTGMQVIEIEFSDREQHDAFMSNLPDWMQREEMVENVTNDKRYKNKNLAQTQSIPA